MQENTHISELKKRYESNRLFILQATGMTEELYSKLLFEQGMAFLDLEYPLKTEFAECRPAIYSDPTFWKWWTSVYKNHEDDFVKFIQELKCVFSVNFYIEEMEQITHESQTTIMFYNQYQKPMYESAKRHWRMATAE